MNRELPMVLCIAVLLAPEIGRTQTALQAGQQAPSAWHVKKLAYDVLWEEKHYGVDQYGRREEKRITQHSSVIVRTGPNLKRRREIESAEIPHWSPSGGQLAFVHFRNSLIEAMQIELANSEGKERKQLTRELGGFINQFAWCSETQIAYILPVSPLGTTVQKLIYQNVDGSQREEATTGSLLICPGKKLTPTANPEQLRELTFGPLPPDDQQVVLMRSELPQPGYSVWIQNADGTERKKLIDDPSATVSVTSAPDGSVVFISTNKHYSEIFRADSNGLKKILSGKPGRLSYSSPVFSPDGRLMVVIARDCVQCENAWSPSSWNFSVLLVDVAAGHRTRLADETNVKSISVADVVWEPTP